MTVPLGCFRWGYFPLSKTSFSGILFISVLLGTNSHQFPLKLKLYTLKGRKLEINCYQKIQWSYWHTRWVHQWKQEKDRNFTSRVGVN